MAGLIPIPGFGDTPWDEIQWARSIGMNGSKFVVGGINDWRPTVVAGADRTVSLALGGGSIAGGAVYDQLSSTENVQFDANTGTTDRYDVLAARWDWSAKTRRFVAIRGNGSTLPAINTSANRVLASVNRLIGDLYDGVVAVVRVRPNVGAFAATDLTDMRVWVNPAGTYTVSSSTALTSFGSMIDGGNAGGTKLWANTPGVFYSRMNNTWAADVWVDSATGRVLRWDGTQAVKIGGPRSVLYESPNFGSSGWVGAGQTANIHNITVASPIPADTGHLHFSCQMQAAAGSSIGLVEVKFAGTAFHQIYNVGTSGGAVVINLPSGVPAGSFPVTVNVTGQAGQASYMSYSSIRVTS